MSRAGGKAVGGWAIDEGGRGASMQTKKEVHAGGRGVVHAGGVVRAMSRAGAERLGGWPIDEIVDFAGRAVEELVGMRGAIPCGWDEVCLMHPLTLHVPLGDL